MSAYAYLTGDGVVSTLPCILYSVLVVNDGQNEATVDIYDGAGAESGYMVARVMTGAKSSEQYHWKGLELSRGLYVDFDSKADHVTIEWSPVGYSEKGREWVKLLRESVS